MRQLDYVVAVDQKFLGKTGVKISEIGLGTWKYQSNSEPLRVGISQGATHIDTAEMYGTEEIVGEAIEGLRNDVFLATKVSPSHLHYDDVLRAAEGSLKRLGVKTIDLYQIHWPNSRIPIKETMHAMEELVKQDKIRFIGVSNFSVREMKEAQEAMASQEIVSNQVEYNLQNRQIESDLIPYCRSQKITVTAYSPLNRGHMSPGENSILDKIALKYGKTRVQLILNFLTAEENIVAIPKSDNVDHVMENCGASGWRLSAEDRKLIGEYFK